MKLTILMDNPQSWYVPYAKALEAELNRRGHTVLVAERPEEVTAGDIAFFLSVEQMIKNDVRSKNKHNIVVHSSDLPRGKGWSPLTWQILEGKNEVVNTLFEAADKVDAGVIYCQDVIAFAGHELLSELHDAQGKSINRLILQFVDAYPDVHGRAQEGEATMYPKRSQKDSELDSEKTIAEQFNLLRVVDNEKYPAFFHYRGKKYLIKIFKEE